MICPACGKPYPSPEEVRSFDAFSDVRCWLRIHVCILAAQADQLPEPARTNVLAARQRLGALQAVGLPRECIHELGICVEFDEPKEER